MEGHALAEEVLTATLPNGLTLLGQPMPNVSSAALTILVPAGASHEGEGARGAAAIASEWVMRGAGPYDTRALHDALDSLGCRHDESVRSEHLDFAAAMLGRNLPATMRVYADILLRPRLDDATFDPCRALARQDLAALDDQPARKCGMMLRERFYPPPLGRSTFGHEECLATMTPAEVRDHLAACTTSAGAVVAAAGNIDFSELLDLAGELFGDWSGGAGRPVRPGTPEGGVTHVAKDSAQTHIGLAHKAVTIDAPRYYAARVAQMVLSGGMASRLFTEVREKRGLAYHVSTRYDSLKGHAGMITYAGTTPPKAQETFDVTVRELRRLAEGVEADELARAKTQLKSALVMQGESTQARADALAGDHYFLGRVRSLDEIAAAVDAVTAGDVAAYLAAYPARDFTVLVVGPEPVDTASIEN
jgi:predicted Zn-dependent peptidase